MHDNISETHIVGENTHQQIIRAEDCAALRKAHIAHVGVADATAPFNVVRTNLSGAYLLGCFGGEGRMLLEGRWHRYRPGMTSLAPAHTMHTFHAIPDARWQFCWVRYTPDAQRSQSGGLAPLISEFDPRALAQAIRGLWAEMHAGANPGSTALWVGQIEHYVARFSDPFRSEDRLRAIWEKVQTDIAHPWSLAQFSAIANLSEEHLRRLCQKAFGRSPMQQLTHLRMQHAAHLLATTDNKIEEISLQVGYLSQFSFSNTFKRLTGYRPSQFKDRSAQLKNAPPPTAR